jgi:hypothetical protein
LHYLFGAFSTRGDISVSRHRIGTDNFFTFDLRSSCEASEVRLQLVRGVKVDESFGTAFDTSAVYDMRAVSTPAAIVNSAEIGATGAANASRVFWDIEDGPSYGGGPYPLDGSPTDVLSFRLNSAGVADFNAARGGFFTVGGSGAGRVYVPANQAVFRNPIFVGVTEPGNLVVTCALTTRKDECKNGGWRNYGVFKNQGDCVSFVATGRQEPASNRP